MSLDPASVTDRPLRTETILLIGAGGVGAPLALHLGNLSRQLVILDDDVFEKSNLHRQPISRGNIGRTKVECLAERLDGWTSAEVLPICERFTEDNSRHILESVRPDLICVAVDNDEARKAIWAHAGEYDILWGANELWEPQAGISFKERPWNPAECFKPAEGGNDPICGQQSIKANLAAANLASFILMTTIEEGRPPFAFVSKQQGVPLYSLDRDDL